jgi:hypothetical protein
MGVGLELLGKHVRCPHCKQVVLAPTSPGKHSPDPQIPIVNPLGWHDQPTPVSPPLVSNQPTPIVHVPNKETAESILSSPDESEDAVFGSSSKNKGPALQNDEASTDAPTQVSASAVPGLKALPEETSEIRPIAPEASTSRAPSASQHPGTPILNLSDPWSELTVEQTESPVEQPLKPAEEVVSQRHDLVASEHDRSSDHKRPRASRPSFRLVHIVLVVVSVYALIATGLAVYGLMLKPSEQLPADHPLSMIPDTFGEFEPVTRKKVTQYRFPVDGELPTELRTQLGGKIEVGQLVIEPTKVEVRTLRIITDAKTGQMESLLPPAIVMSLRITNRSSTDAVHPMDPAFTRRATREDPYPATRLIVDRHQKPFYGGAIEWPFHASITRKYEAAQVNDSQLLTPGESRDYVVFTDADSAILHAVQQANGPFFWRIQVRRGRIEYRGRDIPVTAIIGVEFTRNQIHNMD